ncbi:MAG TPA: flagellar hook-basal body complex protein FliE [Steroidobacteraceae bacterium]|jgi:flagellar hook-basal body complex protein FliE|nr:flagellar hook-basal body complex protein FliE [Steroidobacteraceae bacterium]
MSQMEINQVLAQIRSLSAQTKVGTAPATQTQQTGPSEFANIMRQGLDAVNQSQEKASQLTDAFARGTPGVELPQVMLAAAKANVSFHALSEVRNRLVSAYQDIMNMQM